MGGFVGRPTKPKLLGAGGVPHRLRPTLSLSLALSQKTHTRLSLSSTHARTQPRDRRHLGRLPARLPGGPAADTEGVLTRGMGESARCVCSFFFVRRMMEGGLFSLSCKAQTHVQAFPASSSPHARPRATHHPRSGPGMRVRARPCSRIRTHRPPRRGAAAMATNGPAPPQPAPTTALRTCRRCHARFDPAANTPTSCRFHPAIYTGGEIAKATGFCQAASGPEHSLKATLGRTGLLRFWDCCGSEDPGAPGCACGRHVTYDDPDE